MFVDQALVLLHELGHAWAHTHTSEAQQAGYVFAAGLESWNHPDSAWARRGFEHAADTIAWAMLEEPITLLTPDGPIAQRNAAYHLLTGDDAPRLVDAGRNATA